MSFKKAYEYKVGEKLYLYRFGKIVTTAEVKSIWDDDNGNPWVKINWGLILITQPFVWKDVQYPKGEFRFMQREDGSFVPRARTLHKVGAVFLKPFDIP